MKTNVANTIFIKQQLKIPPIFNKNGILSKWNGSRKIFKQHSIQKVVKQKFKKTKICKTKNRKTKIRKTKISK